ncbi:hypothetical protein V8E36_005856 [Tilletia maclaganii]
MAMAMDDGGSAVADVLQPVSMNIDPPPTTTSPSKTAANKVRILWRGSLLLPDGVPLPGLSIVSTHLPSSSAPSNVRSPRTRIRTSDVFGTPITPIEEAVDEFDVEGQKLENETESDLTLAIEVLRHAPLSVQTFGSPAGGAGRKAALGREDLDLERWTVSSSTSLSLDSAHWSTIDYLQRTLLPPSDPPRVTMTISPPMQDPMGSGAPSLSASLKNSKRLLPPAAPFDVFSEPSNEFAIVPIIMPIEASSSKRGKGSAPIAQPVRLALAQRKRMPVVSIPLHVKTELREPSMPDLNPLGLATPTQAEGGLSATKRRMGPAARKAKVALGSSNDINTGMSQALDEAGQSQTQGPSLPDSSSAPTKPVAPRTQLRQQIKRLTRYALLARGMVESSSSSSSSSKPAQAANGGGVGSGPGMLAGSVHAAGGGGSGSAAMDEYGPCLRAIVAATEAALKPELDVLALPGGPAGSAAAPAPAQTSAAGGGAPLPIELPRIAAVVQAYVQMYAPPLPRAMALPGPIQ